MLAFLTRFKIVTDCQHGFREGRSTETAALSFVNFVYKKLDDGHFVAGLFFDLSRAFDVLSRDFLESKLYNLGFRGIFLQWIVSFIVDRTASVRIGSFTSNRCEMGLGVPQGSVLGPLLFLLYINDLPHHIVTNNSINLIIFADDKSVAVSAHSLGELLSLCTQLADGFEDWCQSNALILNIDKTECMYFRIRNPGGERLAVDCLGRKITSCEHVKFLGVHLDCSLRWDRQVAAVCKKLGKSYYAISRIKNSLPIQSIITVYFSLVYSSLNYNILLWGDSIDSNRVFIAQKRIIRLIFNLDSRESCRPTFKKYQLFTLSSLYIYRCLLYVKENENSIVKLSDFHTYSTRNADTFCIPSHSTTKFKSSCVYQAIILYNHLPPAIKMLNRAKFKKLIKCKLLNNCYYNVSEYLADDSFLD